MSITSGIVSDKQLVSDLEAKFRSSSLPLLSAVKIELRIQKE